MTAKYRLTLLLLLCMMGLSNISIAQVAKDNKGSKVTVEMTYEDAEGMKHTETTEYTGKDAENFDLEEFEKSLEKRDITILNLNISQTVSKESQGELHKEHDTKIKHKGDKENKSVIVKKMITTDSDEKKMTKGDKKQIRIVKTMDSDHEMNVEVKDGKVFINGEEVEESEMNKSSEHRIVIKSMDDKGEENIWMSDDGEEHDIDHDGRKMIFMTDDAPSKPRLGIMIEDGKTVNGATIVDLVPDSPAAKAGLQKGDTVTAINDEPVYGVTSLMDKVSEFKPGDEVNVAYSRGGKSMSSKIKLEMMDTEMQKRVIIKKEKK